MHLQIHHFTVVHSLAGDLLRGLAYQREIMNTLMLQRDKFWIRHVIPLLEGAEGFRRQDLTSAPQSARANGGAHPCLLFVYTDLDFPHRHNFEI